MTVNTWIFRRGRLNVCQWQWDEAVKQKGLSDQVEAHFLITELQGISPKQLIPDKAALQI